MCVCELKFQPNDTPNPVLVLSLVAYLLIVIYVSDPIKIGDIGSNAKVSMKLFSLFVHVNSD